MMAVRVLLVWRVSGVWGPCINIEPSKGGC